MLAYTSRCSARSATSFQALACIEQLSEVRNILVAIFRITIFRKLKEKKNKKQTEQQIQTSLVPKLMPVVLED